MGSRTYISWTGSTWNCLRGCSRTIAKGATTSGCGDPTGGGCYAERNAYRFHGEGLPYEGLVRMTPNGARWTGKVLLVDAHLLDPLRWTDPRMIFTTSVSDPFHESLTNEQIAIMYGVMVVTQQHIHQCLTKRARRRREWFAWVAKEAAAANDGKGMTPAAFCFTLLQRYVADVTKFSDHDRKRLASTKVVNQALGASWPLPNVWEGTSIEHQLAAIDRIDDHLMTPAAVRFLSIEPMIGRVDLLPWFDPTGACCGHSELQCDGCPARAEWRGAATKEGDEVISDPQIHWVIIGAESGPGSRPCEVDWIRDLVHQCGAAGVAVFVKQANEVVEEATAPAGPSRGIWFGEGSKRKGPNGTLIETPYLDGERYVQFPGEAVR